MRIEDYRGDFCEEHDCPIVQITDAAEMVCLHDWIINLRNSRVSDIMRREDRGIDLVLNNGVTLYANGYRWIYPNRTRADITIPMDDDEALELVGNRVIERANEFDPLDYRILLYDEDSIGIEVTMNAGMMLEQLIDLEMIKYEPGGPLYNGD
ncbi:MAG: hypothetical protein JEZ06_24235 [Anaerolineaceae bacterium]|nr:hypothetical protein [Anaerolineaceae bacterium]